MEKLSDFLKQTIQNYKPLGLTLKQLLVLNPDYIIGFLCPDNSQE